MLGNPLYIFAKTQPATADERTHNFFPRHLGVIWGYLWNILGIYWDKGKENGSYYLGFRVWGLGFTILVAGVDETVRIKQSGKDTRHATMGVTRLRACILSLTWRCTSTCSLLVTYDKAVVACDLELGFRDHYT